MKRIIIATCCLLASVTNIHANELPSGMSFIGLTAQGWQAHIIPQHKTKVLPNIFEPRQFSWSPSANRYVYLSAQGSIVDVNNGIKKTVLANNAEDAMTQFRLQDHGKNLVLVRLIKQKSKSTKLAIWKHEQQTFKNIHYQEGKVFDPYMEQQDLFYTHVSCIVSCGTIIQELWHKELTTGKATQLTLSNGTIRHPIFDLKNDRVIYSLNNTDNYNLWQYDISTQTNIQLTQSNASDLWPSLSNDGEIYFVRRDASGGKLYKLNNSASELIQMPEVQDIRDLEITQ